MSDTPMTEEEFAQKVQREGGVLDALDYGLKAEHVVPGELRRRWMVLETSYDAIRDDIDAAEAMVEDLAEAP